MIPAKTLLTIEKTKAGYVLATAAGRTVYWYGKDVKDSGKSACVGGCLSAWPAVTGKPFTPKGVQLAGALGSITRPGGTVQATYNGYPLYTYAADTAAGETSGDGEGGVWHIVTGTALASSTAAAAAGAAASAKAVTAAKAGSGM
jgi:predicted lipoprotein with Yx(FWY)xxD motif